MKTRHIARWMSALVAAAGLLSSAHADDRDRKHLHVGGGLSHPPHTMIMQILYPNIVYDNNAKDTQLTSLDVYSLDPPEPKSPVMVFVHGGGFRVGDKASSKDLDPKPEYFNSKLGYIFVSVNYRLLPDGRFPRNVQDVANSLAWVHDHIAEYGGDPNQIFIMGHSAGARLVAQVTTDETFLKNAKKDLNILKGAIVVDGSYNVAEELDAAQAEATYGPDWKNASPSAHVSKGKGIPPYLLMHVQNGAGISAKTQAQAQAFAAQLKGAGIRADVVPLDHVEHFGANERIGEPGDVTTLSVEKFLTSISTSKRPIGYSSGRPLR